MAKNTKNYELGITPGVLNPARRKFPKAKDIKFCLSYGCKKPIKEWTSGIGIYRFCPECRKRYKDHISEYHQKFGQSIFKHRY